MVNIGRDATYKVIKESELVGGLPDGSPSSFDNKELIYAIGTLEGNSKVFMWVDNSWLNANGGV